jgi:hypothetical protein
MRLTHRASMAALVMGAILCSTTAIAWAGDTKHWTITASGVWFLNNTGDASAPPPPGYTPLFATPGEAVPRTTDDLRLDYGLSYAFNSRWSLAYNHSNVSLSLGRILIGKAALITGDLVDRTDQGTLTYAAGGGLSADAYYSSTQRISTEGICLNQERCPPGSLSVYAPIGPGGYNPASMNIDLYGAGFSYTFGPGGLLTITGDAQYSARPNGQSAANCRAPNNSASGFNAPLCGTNGIPGYVGGTWEFPYSATLNIPFGKQYGFSPFVGYARDQFLFRGVNTPETYNTVLAGFSKTLFPGLSFSYVWARFNGCYCSDNVPPPDSLRFGLSILRLTYAYKF